MENNLNKIIELIVNDSVYKSSELDLSSADIVKSGEHTYNLILENNSLEVELEAMDFHGKTLTLSIEGVEYAIHLHNELDGLIHELGFDQVNVQEEKEILAPMPGLVLKIMVEEGQEVKAGDDLIILEAMKMENVLQAPNDGKIKSIEVQNGAAVEKKQSLILFE